MNRWPSGCWSIVVACSMVLVGNAACADTEDVLGATLRGEFALQSGDSVHAARDYLDAAQKSIDPALARRAAEVALVAHDDALAARAIRRWRQLDPKSDDLAVADALLALRKGDRTAARGDLLAMMAARDDGWKQAIRVLAMATDSATSAQVAGDLLDHARWPANIDAWLAFGELAQRLGDPALSRRVAGNVLRRFPTEPRAWLLEAARQREQGDAKTARLAISLALSLAGNSSAVRMSAASELALLGDSKSAAAALAAGPQDETSFSARAAYLAQVDDHGGLAALYAEASAGQKPAVQGAKTAASPDADRRLLLGQLAEYLGRNAEALAWYQGIPAGQERDLAQNRIAVVLESRGDLAGAFAVLHAQEHDNDADADAQRDSYQLESDLLAKHGRKAEALAVYGRALAFFDSDPTLLYGRALLLEEMDRIAESESDLRTIIAADPDNAEALNALGYTLADRTQRYVEAQALIEKALRLQPDSPAFLDSLGWVQHRLGRDAESLRNLRRAFALQKDAEIAAHLGEVLWLGGDKDAARAVWKQGQAIDKENQVLDRVVRTYSP